MGLDKYIQFVSQEDECVYFFDKECGKWMKLCSISSPRDLPYSVRIQVREAKNRADQILELPLE